MSDEHHYRSLGAYMSEQQQVYGLITDHVVQLKRENEKLWIAVIWMLIAGTATWLWMVWKLLEGCK